MDSVRLFSFSNAGRVWRGLFRVLALFLFFLLLKRRVCRAVFEYVLFWFFVLVSVLFLAPSG